jgi:hypothetical protein
MIAGLDLETMIGLLREVAAEAAAPQARAGGVA